MVINIHQRVLAASPAAVGQILDGLAGADDRLWPRRWPAMRFDRPLGVGARGGHGPIRYHVEAHTRGSAVRFRFERPSGFNGYHEYALTAAPSGETLVRHSLVMTTSGTARITWPLFYRPLHDALIEDSLDQAEESLGLPAQRTRRWSRRVRVLRAIALRASTSGRWTERAGFAGPALSSGRVGGAARRRVAR